MAQHRDISKAHSKLEGEGWHIEYHKEAMTDYNKKHTRRSKKRCLYYRDGMCTHANALCMGVSCGSYFEKYHK